MRLLIIIPAYNEALNIERVVTHLTTNFPQYDYIVVNDGSRDLTADICRENGYNLLDLPVNLGLTGAVQAGIRYAVQNGYDAAIQLDGDGQHRPEYIEALMNTMINEQADIVIGSRFVTEKKPKSLRMLGSDLLSFLIKCSTGQTLTDPTSGMRLYSKKILNEFAYNLNYSPEPDTISYLIKTGAKVREVQVEMDERIAGTSYLNLYRSIKYMLLMTFSITLIQHFRKER